MACCLENWDCDPKVSGLNPSQQLTREQSLELLTAPGMRAHCLCVHFCLLKRHRKDWVQSGGIIECFVSL